MLRNKHINENVLIMKLQRKLKWFLRRMGKRCCVIFLFFMTCWFFQIHLKMVEELSRLQAMHNSHTKDLENNNTKFVMRHENRKTKYATQYKMNKTKLLSSFTIRESNNSECSIVPKFNFEKHADISMYDMPHFTNYSLQTDTNYHFPLPNRKAAYQVNNSQLTIIIVPFSHVDPMYGLTFEKYYSQYVKGILNSVVEKLETYRDMTFQWAEVVFLDRWWQDIDAKTKKAFKKLVRTGQLEIVTGGWVMPDEAVTTVEGLTDQLLEGHQWLQENIGTFPESSWSNDPFGYSGLMPYLLQSSGMKNMVILRIHQAVKATLAKRHALEFMWRPYMRVDAESDVLCHIMPYTGYWIGDSCGPNRTLCREYAYTYGVGDHFPVLINKANVRERSQLLYEQYRITSELYKYNSLYIGLGEDFSYSKLEDWDLTYRNFKKIMDCMNSNKQWKVSVKFGTLREYFKNIRVNEQKSSLKSFPVISGDFFPYSDWNNDYWTGFYTTRPFQKQLSRELERLIRISDVYHVLLLTKSRIMRNYFSSSEGLNLVSRLRRCRRASHTFLHHDGITGTSTFEVTGQNDVNLYQAYTQVKSVLKRLIILMLSDDIPSEDIRMYFETFRESRDSLSERTQIFISKVETKLIVVNPLPRKRKDIISFRSSTDKVSVRFQQVDQANTQVNRYINTIDLGENKGYDIIVSLDLLPYAVETIILTTGGNKLVTEYRDVKEQEKYIEIENNLFTAKFNSSTGMLVSTTHKSGREIRMEAMFMWYDTIHSGPYIFKPLSKAKAMNFNLKLAKIKCLKGDLVSSVITVFREGISITYKIYNGSSIKAHGLHITTEIDIHSSTAFWVNKEFVLRFQTDIHNEGHVFTDQNGFSLIGRKTRDHMPIASNFYPITKVVILEDKSQRLTIHTDHSHGVASLKEGMIEIMLDRTMITDDHKGLGQGIMDNKRTASEFILHTEIKEIPFTVQEERYTYETKLASLMNEQLQNPIILLYGKDSENNVLLRNAFRPLKTSLPCDTTIIGLRNLITENLQYNGTGLTLNRKSFHCGFRSVESVCKENEPVTLDSLFRLKEVDSPTVDETTLTHLHNKRQVGSFEDLRPRKNQIRSFKIGLN